MARQQWREPARDLRVRTGNVVSESGDIVTDTATRIFADLADPQTVNSAKDDGWKAPLWQALADAGLTLAWVPEDQGGAGASLADGFKVARRGGAVCGAGSAGRDLARRVAPLARRDCLARRRHDGRAGAPGRPHHAQFRRHVERARPRGAVRRRRAAPRGARDERGRTIGRAGRDQGLPAGRRREPRRRRFERRDLRPRRAAPRRAGAGRLRSGLAHADGRGGAQRRDRGRARGDPRAQRALCQRAGRLRAADRQVPGGAAQPGAARRRGGGGDDRVGLRRRRDRAGRQLRRRGVPRGRRRQDPLRRGGRRRAPRSPTRCTAPSASPASTCCTASRCGCWPGATTSATRANGRRRSATASPLRGAEEFWPLVASR